MSYSVLIKGRFDFIIILYWFILLRIKGDFFFIFINLHYFFLHFHIFLGYSSVWPPPFGYYHSWLRRGPSPRSVPHPAADHCRHHDVPTLGISSTGEVLYSNLKNFKVFFSTVSKFRGSEKWNESKLLVRLSNLKYEKFQCFVIWSDKWNETWTLFLSILCGFVFQQMAVRCWCLKFQPADHQFLHECHVFSNISRILSKSEEEREENGSEPPQVRTAFKAVPVKIMCPLHFKGYHYSKKFSALRRKQK